MATSTLLTLRVAPLFREPQLTALVLALLQLAALALLAPLALLATRAAGALGRRLHPYLGRANPLGAFLPALVLAAILSALMVLGTVRLLPQLAPLIPWRLLSAAAALALGSYGARLARARRRRRTSRPLVAAAALALALGLAASALTWIGADPATKALALSASPPVAAAMSEIRRAHDFDGDGVGTLFGGGDCAPFDAAIHPGAIDLPDNDIDENCDGRDFVLGVLPLYRAGEHMPIPEAYRRDDYNILLLTVDTVRFDHTTLGGYDRRRGRNTTPKLAGLAERSTSFLFANAPSAGTMASIPAILTSKFFHSGIALDEDVARGMPPRLTPENTLLSEVLKGRGYTTGAILSHYYFNDWGLEQGFDSYDNRIGEKNDPYGVTSDKLTDSAIGWIGRHLQRKWFLWVHYLDPHGRYVAHPGETEYGSSEEDLYDGELAFTDKRLGRLIDYVQKSDIGDRTIIVVTSDHGDAFGEHGYINHAQDLHRELLHVPLIVYVPNLQPQVVEGAVSPIDIFPTLADLAGADIRDLDIQGESLVPQLFYGQDADERVVFAETNYQNHLRAAVNSRYKLIRNLQANSYRLFDLKKDPLETKNVYSTDAAGAAEMKAHLDDWLERVFYDRNRARNQAMAKLGDVLVDAIPAETLPLDERFFDDRRIEVVAFAADAAADGKTLTVDVYFRALDRPSGDFKLQLEVWSPTAEGQRARTLSALRYTGGGLLATGRWRPGEIVRDTFRVPLPSPGETNVKRSLSVGLSMVAGDGKKLEPSDGPLRKGDEHVLVLGDVLIGGDALPAGGDGGPASEN